jgi:hypothetical protein
MMPYRQRFALVSKDLYRRKVVVDRSGVMLVDEYNAWLEKLCHQRTITLICLPQPSTGIRFRLVDKETFSQLLKQPGLSKHVGNGVQILTGGRETGPPHVKPYPVVSQWLMDDIRLHQERISYKLTELIGQLYGPGFGSRHRAKRIGTNLYFGTRGSHQSSPTPVEGPGVAPHGQYHRNYYMCPQWRAFIEKRVKDFMARVQLFGRMLDYAMDEFLPMDQSNALWMQGKLGSVIAFVNDVHVDVGDRLPNALQKSRLQDARVSCRGSTSEYTISFLSYLSGYCNNIGLGYPTTCAYQHVYHPNAQKERMTVHQYFLMPGLGCCCPLVDKIAHRFRADSFSHCTGACVVLLDGVVHWVADGSVYVVAWGQWNTSWKAARRPGCGGAPAPASTLNHLDDENDEAEAEVEALPTDHAVLLSSFRALGEPALASLRSSALDRDPTLRSSHRWMVVEGEAVTEEEFWRTNQDVVLDEYVRCREECREEEDSDYKD